MMSYEEAFYILGNLPIVDDDENYTICDYQEAKAIALDLLAQKIEEEEEKE